jgi:hypothetical protein
LIHQPSDDGTVLRERHQQFEDIRDHLRPYVAERRQAAETSLHDVVRHHRHDEHRFSREHAWVLYPEAALRGLKDWCGIRASVPASRTAGGESVS